MNNKNKNSKNRGSIDANLLGILLLMCVSTILLYCTVINFTSDLKHLVQGAAEYGYFNGQVEASRGDIRVKYDGQAKGWRWVQSPWDDGTKPTFDLHDNKDPKGSNVEYEASSSR